MLLTAQSCVESTTTVTKPSLNLQMVQINTNLNFNFQNGMALARNSPVDLNNLNWTWLKSGSRHDALKEGQDFGVRFSLDYPIGSPALDNVILEITASSKKIPQLGIISSGYQFLEQNKTNIRDEEVNVYKYSFGQLKDGTQQWIILGGQVGTIGFSTDTTTPIIVKLLKENGEQIVRGDVTINIVANVN